MKVLALSAHPDDETLGCGGTLLRHQANGDSISWVIATQAYEPQWSKEVIQRKSDEISQVADAYGIEKVIRLGLPAARLDDQPISDVVEPLREALRELKPELIYTIHRGDVHTDHHVLFLAMTIVLKSFHMREFGVRRILSFETLSSTDAAPPQPDRMFIPQIYHDISPFLERKIEIMNLFGTESQGELMPRGDSAIRALARYRGASIGVEYAEAFTLVREVG